MANNSNDFKIIQYGDEIFVPVKRPNGSANSSLLSTVNPEEWRNTGKYWALGTNHKSRTSATRGTHKVLQSRVKEIKKAKAKAEKEAHKARVDSMQGQLASLGFVSNPNERLRIRNSNGSFAYATILKTGLSHNQLAAIEKEYKEQNRLNAELGELMGDLTMGGRTKRHTKRSMKRSKTHKRSKSNKRSKTHKRK